MGAARADWSTSGLRSCVSVQHRDDSDVKCRREPVSIGNSGTYKSLPCLYGVTFLSQNNKAFDDMIAVQSQPLCAA
jgi:hypothetical protein